MAYNLGFIAVSNLRKMLQLFFLRCWNVFNAMELWLVDHSSPTKKLVFSNNLTTLDNIQSIIQPFTHNQLINIVAKAALLHPDIIHNILPVSTTHSSIPGKLFISRLGYDITSEMLHHYFSVFGEIKDAFVALDRTTGLSKGWGFVFFKNIDSAMLALNQPIKKINGKSIVIEPWRPKITTTQRSSDLSPWRRQIFVSNVPQDMSPHRLFEYFPSYGEIEKGPMGFDKTTGKFMGFAIFVCKTEEGAKAAVPDPSKMAEEWRNSKKQPSFPPTPSIPQRSICGLSSQHRRNLPFCFNSGCGNGTGPGFSSAFCPDHVRLSSCGNNVNGCTCKVASCSVPLNGVADQLRTYQSFFSC